jgi:cytosine deaminase
VADDQTDIVLRRGRPWPLGSPADVVVRDGVIAAVEPDAPAPGALTVDVAGHIVLPGLVEAHAHLDKTLYGGPWEPHSAGDALADRIGNEQRRRAELGIPDRARITALLEAMSAAGTTHVRSHVDVDPTIGLAGVEAVRAAAEPLDERVSVQLVAFPQSGLLSRPGTAELLEAALAEGVEGVGGIDPAGMDGDPVGHLDIVFGLAARYGAFVDIHLHDAGTLGTWQLELIADRTLADGLAGRVTVSHAYGLGQAPAATQRRLAERLAAAGVTILTAAVYDFPVPSLRVLRAAGVNVACGHDGIRDLWGPYGRGDMLERAMHVAYRNTFRRDPDIELALHAATHGGARALGLDAYGVVVGAPADLVVVPARTAAEAVVVHPPRVGNHGRRPFVRSSQAFLQTVLRMPRSSIGILS